MPVYVDDMRAGYGRMVMCHMVADTEAELHAMADLIGVDRKWYQYPAKSRHPHYDIALSKRALAVQAGALEIRMRDAPAIARRCLEAMKRQTGRTTQQMTDAPPGSVYVWCNSRTAYPRELAKTLGRDDLQVVPLLWLDGRNVRGRTFNGVTVDHAAHCDAGAYQALEYLRTRGVLVAG